MTLRKNQLRKLSIDQIGHHLSSETDPENIKLIHTYLTQKNTVLLQRKVALGGELALIRGKIGKAIRNLNGRVRDRIDKKETLVMDKDSRPTTKDVSELMGLFSYLEDQGKIIGRNNGSVRQLTGRVREKEESLRMQAQRRLEYSALDQQFEQLSSECMREQAVREALIRQRDQKRAHYSSIQSSIQTYRREYEGVQSAIRMRERELVQLSGYFQARKKEDEDKLKELPQRAWDYERELLMAQKELNACRALLEERKIMQIQSGRGN